MQHFVAKLLGDERRTSYEFYSGVTLEPTAAAAPAPAPTPSTTMTNNPTPSDSPDTAGCLFTLRCRPAAPVFQLDREEPAFAPPSLNGSFASSAAPRARAVPGSSALAEDEPTASPITLAAAEPTEYFLVWASLPFLRHRLPRVARRVVRSASPPSRESAAAPTTTWADPEGIGEVFCTRTVDILHVDVGAHYRTARDRRIHVVTLHTRDHAVGPGLPPTRGRVGRHCLVFHEGGLTRFLRELRDLLPPSVDLVAGPLGAGTAAAREESVGSSTDSSPRSSGRAGGGRGWPVRWATSLLGLRRRGAAEGAEEQRPRPRPPSPTASPLPSHVEAPRAGTPRSSGSSYVDLSEAEASRDVVPRLHFADGTRVRLSEVDLVDGARPVRATFASAPEALAVTALTEEAWRACFEGPDGVLHYHRLEAVRERVYYYGIAPKAAGIRLEVWLYLLDVFAPNATAAARAVTLRECRATYETLTMQWTSMLPEQVASFRAFRDRRHAVEKDVLRTDRSMEMYRHDDSPHLRVLERVLMAHVQLRFDAGYSQGMSDVASVAVGLAYCSPPLIGDSTGTPGGAPWPPRAHASGREGSDRDTRSDSDDTASGGGGDHADVWRESAAFLCFRAMIAKHMARNFSMDGKRGMPGLLQQVRVLVRHFAPDVYAHLVRCQSDDMTFCFRWILMCFKREFAAVDEVMRVWDTIFACPFTPNFEVVIAVALIVRVGAQMIADLRSCDAVLKFANNLAGNVSVDDVLRCAIEFYRDVLVVEVARLESILQGDHVPPRHPTVEEAVKVCLLADGDIPSR